ncbi:MAG: Eco57I restriction-modification methylase domain-containing protein [Armatimonadetes bacterium]|nr:Eco57I restriction-modification methylase domain-containing protein [Armatimonadota bacterium]
MFDSAFQQVQVLAERFAANQRHYLSPAYDEATARKDFIDKFFIALGWDVNHESQTNPYEQEVRIENKVSMKGSIGRRADYAFFLAPNFREEDVAFFVEAKKPSRSLANKDDYYQTIRYGWNRGTPISVLTDFEEFHIIDCRSKPDLNTALNRKLASFHYTDFANPEKFREVYHLFSREAVANGGLQRYAATLPKPKGKSAIGLFKGGFQPVDEAFLETLDGYRDTLARAFKNRNPALDSQALTEAVQRTLDRVVFIRFLEDRAIEEPRMKEFGEGKGSVWTDFIAYCHTLDLKYNGMLFKQHPIIDSATFTPPDDATFRGIIEEFTDPTSPYNFDQIPISILGSIYERFLGKVITVTAKRATVEARPEVKKAGGVFYTPDYIVRYIVQETIGQLLGDPTNGGKSPAEIEQMAFADIACGSGSFLIEVYAFLIEYHLRWYAANPTATTKDDTATRDGLPKLTIQRRQAILLNNVFGVDIDFQATEVTQLSLYLKLLEEVTMQEADTFAQRKRRLLPDLRKNIVCGNSIVEEDYWGMLNAEADDPTEERRVNALDYAAAFPTIMRRGGFDAVVGNPPYVRQETLGKAFKDYAKQTYSVYSGTADLYVYFFEKAHRVLKPGSGLFGVICSNKFMRANYGKPLRQFLATNTALRAIIDFGELPVFQNAATFPAVFLTRNETTTDQRFTFSAIKRLSFESLLEEVEATAVELDNRSLSGDSWTLAQGNEVEVIEKMKAIGVPLGEYLKGKAKINYGVKTGLNEAFVIDKVVRERLVAEDKNSKSLIRPFVAGDDVRKYHIRFQDRYLLLIPNGWTRKQSGATKEADAWKWFQQHYPAIANHLTQHEVKARKRTDKGEFWWELRPCDYYEEFDKAKIVWPEIAKESRFTLDLNKMMLNKTCFFIPISDYYLLGLLNTSAIWFFLKNTCSVLGDANKGGRLLQQTIYTSKIPIPVLDLSNNSEREQHERMVGLVEQRMELQRKFDGAISEQDRDRYERSIARAEREINALVYRLYGLTAEEVAMVEGG